MLKARKETTEPAVSKVLKVMTVPAVLKEAKETTVPAESKVKKVHAVSSVPAV